MAIDDWDQPIAIQRNTDQMDVGTPNWMVYLLGTSSTASPIFPTNAPARYGTVHPYDREVEAEVLERLDLALFSVGDTSFTKSRDQSTRARVLESSTNPEYRSGEEPIFRS